MPDDFTHSQALAMTVKEKPVQETDPGDLNNSAAVEAGQHAMAEASHAGMDSGQSNQPGSDMADWPADAADVGDSHCAHSKLSHVDLTQPAGKMAASHSSCHSDTQEVPASPEQADTSSHFPEDAAMQVPKTSTLAPTQSNFFIQAAKPGKPAANDAGKLAGVQPAFPLGQSASADESSNVRSSGQLLQDCDGASSCPAGADLGDSHSTADKQAAASVSAESGAEEQARTSKQASRAPEPSMNSKPATATIFSKVTQPFISL